jgi:hypothetical protein
MLVLTVLETLRLKLKGSIPLCVWWIKLIWFLLRSNTTLYYTENNQLHYMFQPCGRHHQASSLCTDSFNTLYRPDDDPHRVETCSLVDDFQFNTKLCLMVINTILILLETLLHLSDWIISRLTFSSGKALFSKHALLHIYV